MRPREAFLRWLSQGSGGILGVVPSVGPWDSGVVADRELDDGERAAKREDDRARREVRAIRPERKGRGAAVEQSRARSRAPFALSFADWLFVSGV